MKRPESQPEARIPPPVEQPPPAPKASPAELEEARKKLQKAVLAYKDLLQSNVLSSNRTMEDNERRNNLIFSLNSLCGELDFLNAGEGLMTLNLAALHSLLLLKDEINDLKFQNAYLHKKIKPLLK